MKRDYYAGALMALLGTFAAFGAMQLQVGTLVRMGPGMFPMVLSGVLILLGLLIALNAGDDAHNPDELNHLADDASPYPDLRGCAAIIGGMLAFAGLTGTFGLVAGTFACVFIAAIGDRNQTWLGSLMLASIITAAGVAIFYYGLKMPFALLKWPF